MWFGGARKKSEECLFDVFKIFAFNEADCVMRPRRADSRGYANEATRTWRRIGHHQ